MNKYAKRYLIDAMSGMAQGLFCSLLIGTIVKTLGQQLLRLGENAFFKFLVDAGSFASFLWRPLDLPQTLLAVLVVHSPF